MLLLEMQTICAGHKQPPSSLILILLSSAPPLLSLLLSVLLLSSSAGQCLQTSSSSSSGNWPTNLSEPPLLKPAIIGGGGHHQQPAAAAVASSNAAAWPFRGAARLEVAQAESTTANELPLASTNSSRRTAAATTTSQKDDESQSKRRRQQQLGQSGASQWRRRSRRNLAAAAAAAAANQDDCERPAVFGLRCDEGGELHNGSLVIKANEPTRLMLIGRSLSANISVALTPASGFAQEDCTHTDRVKSLQVSELLSPNIALVEIDLPSPGPEVPFYLCVRDSSQAAASNNAGWFHQGSAQWLRIYVKQDFLPLYMKIFVIACLLMLSGLFSGLNLGLMALDKNELQVIISCGSETEKRYARAIEPVRRRGNYLLCSILFSNVLVNSTIAVLLEELTSGIVAVMTSTIFIVMFGEILPQAFCSRHGLAVGAKTVSITYFCMIVTFPLSYPVSSCLDWALGEEIGHAYDRERLMEFIRVTRDYNNLETDEVNIISGALKLKRIQLREVMTRIEDVYMLDVNSCLDFDTIQAIIEKGYSRIPVHEANNKKNIVALLFAKDLALLDPDDRTPVQTMISFYNHPIMYLFEDTTLDSALNEFKTGKSHLAFVRRVLDDGDRDPVYEITGIVTLEDVIEEIMQMEINDETDILSDNRRKRRRKDAQVRKDFSQFANLGGGDSSYNVVTAQHRLAAYQYLATTVDAFASKNISDSVLKRLLSQKIYFKVRADEQLRERCLYNAGEPADYFIMILEGRVHVVCGKENLVFDGGPFSYFGQAALATTTNSGGGGGGGQDAAAVVSPQERRESGRPIANSSGQFSVSMRKLEQAAAAAANDEPPGGVSPGRSASNLLSGGGGLVVQKLKASGSSASIHSAAATAAAAGAADKQQPAAAGQSHFIPDYTVEVVTNCSYLKVTRNEYLTAFRATLVERGACPADGGLFGADDDADELANQASQFYLGLN